MTIKYFYFLLMLLVSTTSCTAQIEVISASRGNTGHRGIQPRDEQGNRIDPPKGRDYYNLDMKTKGACTVELLHLTVKTNDGQILTLSPMFTDGDRKKNKMIAEQTFYVRAEIDEMAKPTKQTLKGEGLLKVKINGKTKTVPIENFTLTLPQ
jgi:hypothetical protein